jgi:anti-anti-sigma factor
LPHSTFELAVYQRRERIVVRLIGELDAGGANRLRDEAASALESSPGVDIDLERLTFVDSTGAAELLRLHLRGRDTGCDVRIVNVPRLVRRSLEMMGLAYVLADD